MVAEITKTKEDHIAGTSQTHWDVVEVWETQANSNDEDPNILVKLGINVLTDNWLGINSINKELEIETFWDAKSCQEDKDINCQLDTEIE